MAVVREVARNHPDETVLLSMHGGPIKCTVFDILGAPISSWDRTWIANGSITTERGTADLLRLAAFNDTCHLDSEPRRRVYV
jgi:broad specificity phosphatase PhoE